MWLVESISIFIIISFLLMWRLRPLGFCNPFFYGNGWLAHRPTPNREGQWFSVGVFHPLAHRFLLFRGTGHSSLAAVTRLLKHSQGLRWRGRVTNDFSDRTYSLTVGITRHLRGTHWWHLWTSSRPVTIALSLLKYFYRITLLDHFTVKWYLITSLKWFFFTALSQGYLP